VPCNVLLVRFLFVLVRNGMFPSADDFYSVAAITCLLV